MMQHIGRCLNPLMSKVCEHVLTLETLTAVVRGYFTDEDIKPHCTVTSFNKGCLVVTVSNAMWASQLRYQLPSLRDYLRQHAGLHQLITLKLNIHLEHTNQTAVSPSPSKLSAQGRQHILHASHDIQHPPLQEALQRLALNQAR